MTGGPVVRTFCLNYGRTAVSLATNEAATTKKSRIVLLPELTQAFTVNQINGTIPNQPLGGISTFSEPIYVNPGEYVGVAVKHIGSVGTSGTIATNIQLVYGWE